jgi:hypothetical protein
LILSLSTGFSLKNYIYSNNHCIHNSQKTYSDLIVTLLYPYIEEPVENFYKQYIIYGALFSQDELKILSIEKPKDSFYSFTIVIEITPYLGPHNTIGRDRITLTVSPDGKVTLNKFEHIESFEIAPNYKQFIKLWPPPN